MTTVELKEIYKLVVKKYFDIVGENPDVIDLLESGHFSCGVWKPYSEDLNFIRIIEL